MADVNETNTRRLMLAYRVVFREDNKFKTHDEEGRKTDVPGQNPKFRVIDGERKGTDALKDSSSAVNMADRVMEEIGDNLPFEIIEGGRIEDAAGDRVVSGSKGVLHVVWDSSRPTENSFLNRVKKLFK